MKRSIFIIAFILFAIQASANNRWAIVVGISHYPKESGWGRISGAEDINIVVPMLTQNGFDENHIITLTEEHATKKEITSAFDNLTNQVKSGDVVYFHFSGHGQRITDLNGDDVDEDGVPSGYDTALVPYDAYRKYDPIKYRGENHIIDDELNEWLHAIKAKIGPEGSLIVVLDACHSGGGTRDEDEDDEQYIIRGGEPFDIRGGNADQFNLPNSSGRNVDNTRQENWICLSACTQIQSNYEYEKNGKYCGRLSSAIADVISAEMTGLQLVKAIATTPQYSGYPNGKEPQNLKYDMPEELNDKKIL